MHCQKITDKTGPLVGIAAVDEEEDLMIVTAEGVIIRTPVAGINVYSKDALGVIIMRMKDENKIVNFSTVAKEEEAAEGQPNRRRRLKTLNRQRAPCRARQEPEA